MRNAGINQNRIAGSWVLFAAVALDDFDLRHVAQIILGPSSELGVDFHRSDPTGRSDNFGDDRRVVAWAATDVDYMISCF